MMCPGVFHLLLCSWSSDCLTAEKSAILEDVLAKEYGNIAHKREGRRQCRDNGFGQDAMTSLRRVCVTNHDVSGSFSLVAVLLEL